MSPPMLIIMAKVRCIERTYEVQLDQHVIDLYMVYIQCIHHLNSDTGVAVGTEFCNAESPALRDATVWVVTVKDGKSTLLCTTTVGACVWLVTSGLFLIVVYTGYDLV